MSDIEDDQLLHKCKLLQNEVSSIKELKLLSIIQVYDQQCQQESNKQLATHQHNIARNFQQHKAKINAEYRQSVEKLMKSKEEMGKQIYTYEAILEQLREKKKQLIEEFNQSLIAVSSGKDKNISEWKKASNQEIMRANMQAYIKQKKERKSEKYSPDHNLD